MIGRTTTCLFSATGRSRVACTPRIADCGGLMIGVDSIDPNTPPLLIVYVPPVSSSTVSRPPARACRNRRSFLDVGDRQLVGVGDDRHDETARAATAMPMS